MKVLVFDNYDSFTYNLVHILRKIIPGTIDVYKNDELPLERIGAYDKILISPGPGIPEEAGLTLPLIREYASTKSILGVCLGHQAIGQAFGGSLANLSSVFHGVSSTCHITSDQSPLFAGMPRIFNVGRYHSWVISDHNFPDALQVTARDERNTIMAVEHKSFDVKGVQFHPESVLTEGGEAILRNWLKQ